MTENDISKFACSLWAKLSEDLGKDLIKYYRKLGSARGEEQFHPERAFIPLESMKGIDSDFVIHLSKLLKLHR